MSAPRLLAQRENLRCVPLVQDELGIETSKLDQRLLELAILSSLTTTYLLFSMYSQLLSHESSVVMIRA